MSSKNPLADRGKASEDAWIREQERLAREKAKAEGGANGDKKKGCVCKKSGGQGECACKKAGGSCGA